MAECSVCYTPNSTLRCPTCKTVYCSVEHQKIVWYAHKHFHSEVVALPYFQQAEMVPEEEALTLLEWQTGSLLEAYIAGWSGFDCSDVTDEKSLRAAMNVSEYQGLLSFRRACWSLSQPQEVQKIKEKYRYLRSFYRFSFIHQKLLALKLPFPLYKDFMITLFNTYSIFHSSTFEPKTDSSVMSKKYNIVYGQIERLEELKKPPLLKGKCHLLFYCELLAINVALAIGCCDAGIEGSEKFLRDLLNHCLVESDPVAKEALIDLQIAEGLKF